MHGKIAKRGKPGRPVSQNYSAWSPAGHETDAGFIGDAPLVATRQDIVMYSRGTQRWERIRRGARVSCYEKSWRRTVPSLGKGGDRRFFVFSAWAHTATPTVATDAKTEGKSYRRSAHVGPTSLACTTHSICFTSCHEERVFSALSLHACIFCVLL